MRRYLPILIVIILLTIISFVMVYNKQNSRVVKIEKRDMQNNMIGDFGRQKSCGRVPTFLKSQHIPQPVMIDLSQKQYRGLTLRYGKQFREIIHPKEWEIYGSFGTYSIDKRGNIYLIPMPFISIEPTTFNLQKNIYRVDSKTGKLSIWMHLDDIVPTSTNPYGLNAITYDCVENTLWIATIDKSDYQTQRGIIYQIDIETKSIIGRIDGIDVLSLSIINSAKGKFLLAGSARDSALYSYRIGKQGAIQSPSKLLELPDANMHIRKIKVSGDNVLELQAIPFSYTLITQTSKEDRKNYKATLDRVKKVWKIDKN